MFFFYHPEQTLENSNYLKGKLFEDLLAKYLFALGFNIQLRRKHHSLEYDLDGEAQLDKRRLIGEAKAHGRPISGEVLSSFVGKLFPLHKKEPNLVAVFLSTSSLTAEADDFLGSLDGTGLNLHVLTGDALLANVAEKLGLPSAPVVQEQVRELGYYALSQHMLVTNQGPYVLQIAASDTGATPAYFGLIRRDGRLIADSAFLQDVQLKVTDLQELAPISPQPSPQARSTPREAIPEGLILGNDWADFRLPAPPHFFVGRRHTAERLLNCILGDNNTGVLQLKSRSGVGKSSLMAYIAEGLRQRGAHAQLYDARNIKSVLDLWAVVQRFTGSSQAASDSGDLEKQITSFASEGQRSVLLVDQFESTFADPDLFAAFELLAMACVKLRPNLCVVFARKNDLLTTYDDSQISLERLNELSESILLEDFSAPEAVELIEKISRHTDRRISAELKAYVLEFAQGFPWLLKRTMAHVIQILRRGEGQAALLSAALRLDDLFDEELEELDEVERDYMLRIAQRLPATYHQLDRYFDEDPYLPRILDRLTRERLLRLSGSTYDTYNDVFKEYLVYRRLPEFRMAFVYRLSDKSVIPAFPRLAELRRFSTEAIQTELKKSKGSVFNLLRELRNVGLVDKDGSDWIVPEAALDAYDRQRLGEYIRQQLVKNGLVGDLLGHLQTTDEITLLELPTLLKSRFPFVDASDSTWRAYSTNLIGWLQSVQLISISHGVIALVKGDRAEVARRIGNLKERLKRTRAKCAPIAFLPGAWWCHVERALELLGTGHGAQLNRQEVEALRDLIELGLATSQQELTTKDPAQAKVKIARMLMDEPYASFWQALDNRENPVEALATRFVVRGVSVSTLLWRVKILLSWGTGTGVVSKRYRIQGSRILNGATTGVVDEVQEQLSIL